MTAISDECQSIDNLPNRLELGCGNNKSEDAWGIDHINTSETDQVQDLNEENWNLPSNHFTWIRAKDVIEHLDNPVNFLEEVYRISKPGAKIIIKAPHFTSPDLAADPTHQRAFSYESFSDFTDNPNFGFYTDAKFKIVEKEIRFAPFRIQPHKHIGYFLANKIPRTYEHTFLRALFPARDVKWVMEAVK